MKLVIKSLAIAFILVIVSLPRMSPTTSLAAGSQPPALPEQPQRPVYDPLYLETARLPGAVEQPINLHAPQYYFTYSAMVIQNLTLTGGVYNYEIFYNSNLENTNLTNRKADDVQPKLNPGCTSIVFASDYTGNLELYTMKPDGSGLTQITWHKEADYRPDWSPDSSRIVFESYRDGQAEIYTQAPDGSSLTRVTQDENYDGMPAWSPDGKRIAFVSNRTGGYRVYVMNTDGSGLALLSSQPYSSYPVWSPDSSQIAFSADGDGDGWWELWSMRADGSDETLLFRSPLANTDIIANSWAPNEPIITFTQAEYVLYNGSWYWERANIRGWDYLDNWDTGIYLTNMAWYADWQTLDNLPPVSAVLPMTSPQPFRFLVEWQGSDNMTPIRQYDVQIRDGLAGTWADLVQATTETYAWIEGQGGHTYFFRSRAYDYAGNVEAWPADYDIAVKVESSPPATSIKPLPRFSNLDGVLVSWNGYDPGGSEIQTFNIEKWDEAEGVWHPWLDSEWPTGADFAGEVGHTYRFRSWGVDWAGNVEMPLEEGDATITFYSWLASGRVTDHTGTPVQGAQLEASLVPFLVEEMTADGNYLAAFSENPDTKSMTITKPPYGSLPPSLFSGTLDAMIDFALPPADNLVADWGFEDDAAALVWSLGGAYTPSLDATGGHSGEQAALLGGVSAFSAPFDLELPYSFNKTVTAFGPGHTFHLAEVIWLDGSYKLIYRVLQGDQGWQPLETVKVSEVDIEGIAMAVDSQGVVHLLWGESNQDVYYIKRDTNGTWSAPVKAFTGKGVPYALQVAPDDTLHLVLNWSAAYYAQKPASGTWSTPQAIPGAAYSVVEMQVTPAGAAHFVYKTDQLYYVRRGLDGNWSATTQLSIEHPIVFCLRLNSSDLPQLVWNEQLDQYRVMYRAQKADGSWTSPSLVTEGFTSMTSLLFDIDPNDRLHVVWDGSQVGYDHGFEVYYVRKVPGEDWSEPQNVSGSAANSEHPSLGLTPDGNLLITWRDSIDYTGMPFFAWVIDGTAKERGLLAPGQLNYASPRIAYDRLGSLQVLWAEGEEGALELKHAGSVYAMQDGVSWVQQAVSLPNTMDHPFLSFLYRLEGVTGLPATGFEVRLTSGEETKTLFSTQHNSGGWEHTWFDLSAWSGQEVILTFRTAQVEGELLSSLKLDEVTIGEGRPDVWVEAVGAWSSLPGERFSLYLRYGNQGAVTAEEAVLSLSLPAGLSFYAANVPPSQVEGDWVEWSLGSLPAESDVRLIELTLQVETSAQAGSWLSSYLEISTQSTELELVNNRLEIETYIGGFAQLPIVAK